MARAIRWLARFRCPEPSLSGHDRVEERKRNQVGRTRRKFSEEFKRDAVEIVRSSGMPIAEVARELGIYDSSLGNWVRQDEINRGQREGLSSDDRHELSELRRENVLHVPDMAGRYYSVQFTDPSYNTNFAYVGKRTTGTQAGDHLVSGPGWEGQVRSGMTQISSPNNSVLVLGRVFVKSDSDLSTAYYLSKQIHLTPLSDWQPNQ